MIRIAALALALGLWGTSLAAQQDVLQRDPDAPIEIHADNLEVQRDQQVAIFTGNVDAQQGRLTLRTDELRVSYREGGSGGDGASIGGRISKLEAIGNVEVATETERATGARGVYNVDGRTIELVGNVRLHRERNVLTGNRLVMDLASGVSRLDGEAGGGRVKGIFIPDRSDN